MKTLYLATISATEYEYMGRSRNLKDQLRLIWADTQEEAETKARSAVQRHEPYGTSVEVDYVELSEAIQ